MSEPDSEKVVPILQTLAKQGWISLRSLGVLFGYKSNSRRAIYARQRGRNAIPSVKVGGIIRVYEQDVLNALYERAQKDPTVEVIAEIYRTVKRRHEKESTGDTPQVQVEGDDDV